MLVGDQDLEGILVDAELAVVKGFQVEEKLDPVLNSAADRGGLRIRQDPQAGCRGTLIMMFSMMTMMMNPNQVVYDSIAGVGETGGPIFKVVLEC